jgi:tRNA nucleotidyltransferase (CCA-adding enzyme)
MKTPEIIATHTNTDFDAFAAMVAAHKLYPAAHICLGNAVNRNVREFHNLYADQIVTMDPAHVDLESVRRLILVDTVHPNRLGDLGDLCAREDVEVVVFDHHRAEAPPVFVDPERLIVSDDGSLVTLMLRIVAARRVAVTPLEATVFALGIHEDTGSLTFSTTTERDAEALAFCMRQGADQGLIQRYLDPPLTEAQRATLARALDDCRPLAVPGLTVLVASVEQPLYVEGVSVVAHKVMDLTGCDAFFLLVKMEDRLFVTARSRGESLDVAQALKPVGGGGHAAAASAVLRDTDVEAVRAALAEAVAGAVRAAPSAGDVMQAQRHVVAADSPVDEALLVCRRHGLGGVLVADADEVVGTVSQADLERAAGHDLGHAPVKAVMTSRIAYASRHAPLSEVAELLAQARVGWVPVADPAPGAPLLVQDIAGMVKRSDILKSTVPEEVEPPPADNVAGSLSDLGMDELFAHIQAVAAEYRGVYLVGGAVRDLLLGERTIDIDIAVEGDGIEFAGRLAERLGGHVRPHSKFQTAVVVAPAGEDVDRLRVDVASTRTEFYDFPAALPKVEHASIRSDLARRDFSMNALAVSLEPQNYGALLDYFSGREDLSHRRVVVLHNLSFIEDPTRIFRAIRYESRYGLRMDAHTLNLAQSCSEMDLIGDLSSARLRDELVLLLSEPSIEFGLRRLRSLGIEKAVHARFRADDECLDLIHTSDALWRRHRLAAEVPLWRARLVWLLRTLAPEEISAWALRMRFRRRDREVLARALVVSSRLGDLLHRGPSETALYDAAVGEPADALLAAMALQPAGDARERLGRFLDTTRHVRLAVSGADLLELGFASSREMGVALRDLLHLKIKGVVDGREAEIEAARRMR